MSSSFIYYQNCRSYVNKFSDFKDNLIVSSSYFEIIILTETWLHFDIKDNTICPKNYQIYRADGDPALSFKSKGEVIIKVHNNNTSTFVSSYAGSYESLFIKVKINEVNYIIGACYFPQHSSPDLYYEYLSEVENIYRNNINCTFIITGDYNVPGFKWSNFNGNNSTGSS